MIVLAILLAGVGLVLACRLAFTLVVYALPVLLGAGVCTAVHAHGVGIVAAVLLGALAGAVALAACHFAMETLRPSILRTTVAALFTTPAAFAGYHLAHGLTALLTSWEPMRQIVALSGALLVAGAAWARLTFPRMAASPDPSPLPGNAAAQRAPR